MAQNHSSSDRGAGESLLFNSSAGEESLLSESGRAAFSPEEERLRLQNSWAVKAAWKEKRRLRRVWSLQRSHRAGEDDVLGQDMGDRSKSGGNTSGINKPRRLLYALATIITTIIAIIAIIAIIRICSTLLEVVAEKKRLLAESSREPCHIAALPAVQPFPTVDLRQIISFVPASDISRIRGFEALWHGVERTTFRCAEQVADFNNAVAAASSSTWNGALLREPVSEYHRLYPVRMRGVESKFSRLKDGLGVLAEVVRALHQEGMEFADKAAREGDEGLVRELRDVLRLCVASLDDAATKAEKAGEAWWREAEMAWKRNEAVMTTMMAGRDVEGNCDVV
ncbi:unnamed protein product [Zymoseptoria tritici ST99CH_1E4]|uniref:Uncharacterized protein n=1 Tax=Zymoseptoria tritici ST99CH_1E4 TaxID=1276532 RepID=A0A2H1HBT4_ZYMTR|nr:unnamed protein product [Zymoseptoria tritici ST99CH_1E4]